LSTESRPIKVAATAPNDNIRADKIAIETAKTKVTAVVMVMSFFCKKKCNLQNAKSKDKRHSCQKPKSADFLEENSCRPRNLSQKMRKAWFPKKLAYKLKKLELNSTNIKLKSKKTRSDCTKKSYPSISSGPKVKNKTIRVRLTQG
jgi:hypothetical protein